MSNIDTVLGARLHLGLKTEIHGISSSIFNFGRSWSFCPFNPYNWRRRLQSNTEKLLASNSKSIVCSYEGSVHMSGYFAICRDAKLYIEEQLLTEKFGLVIHGGNGGGAKLSCLEMAKKFYQLLKNRLARLLK